MLSRDATSSLIATNYLVKLVVIDKLEYCANLKNLADVTDKVGWQTLCFFLAL